MTALRPVLDAVPALRVLVVGDALLDEYLHGGTTRICREAPVPQVTVQERRPVPGGAGNVAANVAALGARVRFLTVVGDDRDGGRLAGALEAAGVGTGDVLVEPGRTTVAKRRIVAADQMVLRVDEGGPAPMAAATRARLLRRLPALFAAADVVLVSDYGYGVLDDEVVAAVAQLQAATPWVLVVDARDVTRFRDVRPTAVTPSFSELAGLVGTADGDDRAAAVAAACGPLHERTGARIVAVTMDRDGAMLCEDGRPPYRTWTTPVPHSRACGAGDSFAAGLALALAASGGDVPVAAEVAQAAAAVVTGRDGTSTCSLEDLRAHLADTTTQLEGAAELAERVAYHRRQGRRIVFTNGCFDLLHRGHIDLLNRAKRLGDVLVVGLNSDDSMAALKDRPINRLEDRARVLAALSSVDHLAAFDEPTAAALVDLVRPDVYVKGGDYVPDMVPEAPHVEAHGGTVRILPYLEDRTTAALIRRIRAAEPAGAAGPDAAALAVDASAAEAER